MEIEVIRAFFGWCTLINGAFLVLTFLFSANAAGWIYKMHSKWFSIDREAFTLVLYCFIGAMKIFFILFSLVPYLALVILT